MMGTITETMAVNPRMTDRESVIEFLGEIRFQYPDAITLASGCPDEAYFEFQNYAEYIEHFSISIAEAEGIGKEEVFRRLGQYNKTKGLVSNILKRYLEKDEHIMADEEDIVLTVGIQEGIAISVITLCDREKDVILIEDPTFIGVSDFSYIAGYQVETVPVDSNGIALQALKDKIHQCQSQGKRVKMLYTIPNFQNPTGNSIPLENRSALLAMAEEHDFYILEDNAYNNFSYQDHRPPSLKSIDQNNSVIYLHSFAKSIIPGLRLGIMVANQTVEINDSTVALSDLMTKTKAHLSLNTPALSQAYLGGYLLKNDYSILQECQPKVEAMLKKRDQMLLSLENHLGTDKNSWAEGVSWNKPEGGFFITLTTPVPIDKSDVDQCAREFNVIITPMNFFYFDSGGEHEIRLSFSHIAIDQIDGAIEQLSKFLAKKII